MQIHTNCLTYFEPHILCVFTLFISKGDNINVRTNILLAVNLSPHSLFLKQTKSGKKTRNFEDICSEVMAFFDIHHELGTHPGGMHIEMTGP